MMRTVHLYGRLKKLFGESFRFDLEYASEAFRALNCAFPGQFIEAMKEGSYEVIRGDLERGFHLNLDTLTKLRMGNSDLHIVPVAEGASATAKRGTELAILGVAIVGAAIFFSGGTLAAPLAGLGTTAFSIGGAGVTWGTIATFGVGLALLGVSGILTKAAIPAFDDSSPTMGPTNVNAQGAAVPLIYGGPILVGSQAVSAGLDVEDIGIYRTGV